eukprot:s4085_g6.t1
MQSLSRLDVLRMAMLHQQHQISLASIASIVHAFVVKKDDQEFDFGRRSGSCSGEARLSRPENRASPLQSDAQRIFVVFHTAVARQLLTYKADIWLKEPIS